jgi:hypothetical protein
MRANPTAEVGLGGHSGNAVTGNACFDSQKTPTQSVGILSGEAAGESLVSANYSPVCRVVAAPALPCGEIRLATATPTLDGRLDDAVWKEADLLRIDGSNANGSDVTVGAEVRLLHDARNLYVGVRCADPLADRIADKLRTRNSGVWSENDLELFLDPDAQGRRCYQFVINSLGTIFERQYDGTTGSAWNSQGAAVTYRGADFWSAEIVISLEALSVTALTPSREWKTNVCRLRTTCSPVEETAWSPTRGGFLLPRRFGTLVIK